MIKTITTLTTIIYVTDNTTDNTHVYQNHQHRRSVNSTELTKNSDPINTTLPTLPNVNTPRPRLHRQNSVLFNTEPIILCHSTQPTPTNNQNVQITQQQLGNIVRQINSQITQQNSKAPTPYYLKAASAQMPSPVLHRNAHMIYPYLGGSVPMQ